MNEYTSQILDYSQNPPNYGQIENCNYTVTATNPSCGDNLTVYLSVGNNGKITNAKFWGEGCAISKASASMTLELLIGKNFDEINNLKQKDILNLLQIKISPTRAKCAYLILNALDNISK